jgi:hypothetical protein
MSDAGRKYKDYKIYSCFVLNKLVSALGIDIYQENLEEKVDDILDRYYAQLEEAYK